MAVVFVCVSGSSSVAFPTFAALQRLCSCMLAWVPVLRALLLLAEEGEEP